MVSEKHCGETDSKPNISCLSIIELSLEPLGTNLLPTINLSLQVLCTLTTISDKWLLCYFLDLEIYTKPCLRCCRSSVLSPIEALNRLHDASAFSERHTHVRLFNRSAGEEISRIKKKNGPYLVLNLNRDIYYSISVHFSG